MNNANIHSIARELVALDPENAYRRLKNNSGSLVTRLNSAMRKTNFPQNIDKQKLKNIINRIANEEEPQELPPFTQTGAKRNTRRSRKTRRSHKRRGHTRRH